MGAPPTVIFLNGLGETLDFWHLVLARLPGVATLAFDRPEWPGGVPGDLDEAMAEMDGILAEVSGELLLVGHSFGGLLAEAYARSRPGRVRGLVLVDPTVPSEYATDDPPAHRSRLRTMFLRALLSETLRSPLGYLLPRAMVGLGTTRSSTRNLIANLPTGFGARLSDPRHLARAVQDNDVVGSYCRQVVLERESAPMPLMPVRVLVGGSGPRVWQRRQDTWIAAQEEQLPAFGDDAMLEVLDGAHILMIDCPVQVATTIKALHGA